MAILSAEEKNTLLRKIAMALRENSEFLERENAKDIHEAEKANLGPMIDRLLLTKERIEGIARDTEKVAELKDFVGEVLYEHTHANGMKIQKVRVSMGLICMIYESRPNVTVDAAVLSLKSGNAVLLKGGKEAMHSNLALIKIMKDALLKYSEAIQLLSISREEMGELFKMKGKIDLLIPRGGKGLIDFVTENSRIPVIATGASVVHTFVDEFADLDMAVNICVNEKVRRVAVCNVLDTLLLHEKIAEKFLKKFTEAFHESVRMRKHPEIEIFADKKSFEVLKNLKYEPLQKVDSESYDTEWLDYKMSIRVVSDLDEALLHIREHSLGHSESIVTMNAENAKRFLDEVDAACVYHNVSTCFSDGAEFGLGAEIGISTQKLHARGPFALEALTSTKWMVKGEGQVRW